MGIRHLVQENIIDIPENTNQDKNEIIIPQWFKTTTSWWAEGMIPDNDYAKGVEFLLKKGIIIV